MARRSRERNSAANPGWRGVRRRQRRAAGRKAEARAARGGHIARRPETALEHRWAELI
ncbi:hypothetical protein [Candidatus Binatus sp.]|uniref:hypothetical protein n=1 Tax=Candidatus Binatus sp. TaxID=2811406 RepID=UPI003CC558EE